MKNIYVFTDGACSGNPGPGGWAAILCSGEHPSAQVRELGGSENPTTNNRMEMRAALEALKHLGQKLKSCKVELYTDSTYLIRGITAWVFAWEKRGWLTAQGNPVENQDLWKELLQTIRSHKLAVDWCYVPGHSGYAGNERCDRIAVSFSQFQPVSLSNSSYESYVPKLFPLPPKVELPALQSSPLKPKGKVTYLSLVGQKLERHQDWKSCEARVKGTTGAKFKKVSSKEEEEAVLKSWGVFGQG